MGKCDAQSSELQGWIPSETKLSPDKKHQQLAAMENRPLYF